MTQRALVEGFLNWREKPVVMKAGRIDKLTCQNHVKLQFGRCQVSRQKYQGKLYEIVALTDSRRTIQWSIPIDDFAVKDIASPFPTY